MKKTIYYSGLILIFSFLTIKCKKDEFTKIEKELKVESEALGDELPIIIDTISEIIYPNFSEPQKEFDWETLDNLPLFGANEPVPMPWSNNAKIQFSTDIINDYKKSDGWELYLTNFSPNRIASSPYVFSLYNKYRGIIRYYFFNDKDIKTFQDYKILEHSIYATTDSPILNFTGQNIIDLNDNSRYVCNYEPQGLANSSWYAVEYELAFDKGIYTNTDHFFILDDYHMRKLYLNTMEASELNSKITVYGTGGRMDNYVSANSNYILYGKNDLNKISNKLSNRDINSLNKILYQNDYSNTLNALIVDKSILNLKWPTKLDMSLYSTVVGLPNYAWYISGKDLSNEFGDAPFYNQALGVFYLNRKPTYTEIENEQEDLSNQYILDVNSVEYIFNPSILELAEIKNIQQELVASEFESLVDEEGMTNIFVGQILKSNKPLFIQGVRVSFDVIPFDGAKPVHIIKTFKAELKN